MAARTSIWLWKRHFLPPSSTSLELTYHLHNKFRAFSAVSRFSAVGRCCRRRFSPTFATIQTERNISLEEWVAELSSSFRVHVSLSLLKKPDFEKLSHLAHKPSRNCRMWQTAIQCFHKSMLISPYLAERSALFDDQWGVRRQMRIHDLRLTERMLYLSGHCERCRY